MATNSVAASKRKASVSGFASLWESHAKHAKEILGTDLTAVVAKENSWSESDKQMYDHVYRCFPNSDKPDSEAAAAVYDKCIKRSRVSCR